MRNHHSPGQATTFINLAKINTMFTCIYFVNYKEMDSTFQRP